MKHSVEGEIDCVEDNPSRSFLVLPFVLQGFISLSLILGSFHSFAGDTGMRIVAFPIGFITVEAGR